MRCFSHIPVDRHLYPGRRIGAELANRGIVTADRDHQAVRSRRKQVVHDGAGMKPSPPEHDFCDKKKVPDENLVANPARLAERRLQLPAQLRRAWASGGVRSIGVSAGGLSPARGRINAPGHLLDDIEGEAHEETPLPRGAFIRGNPPVPHVGQMAFKLSDVARRHSSKAIRVLPSRARLLVPVRTLAEERQVARLQFADHTLQRIAKRRQRTANALLGAVECRA